MKYTITILLLVVYMQRLHAQCQHLVWSDEFDAQTLDVNNWTPIINGNGGGNNELQYYTDNAANVSTANGNLQITARQENYMGANYTSGRIHTRYKVGFKYGRIEARIKMPYGRGIWPAFWMLPTEGNWPIYGEIDIMELLGHQPNKTYATIHGSDTNNQHVQSGVNYTLPTGSFADNYHLYALEWNANSLSFYVDEMLIGTKNKTDLPTWQWNFDKEFYLLLNVAVGGNWPGSPDATTVFPQTMLVDYVRVYQQLPDMAITGQDRLEPYQQNKTYSFPFIAGANYTWSVPTGATIVNGQNSNQISVNWGNEASSGNITLHIVDACSSADVIKPVVISRNLWDNAGFEANLWHWNYRNGGTAASTVAISNNAPEGLQAACVTVTALGSNIWDVQLSRPIVPLVAGQSYTLTFAAKADTPGKTIQAAFIHPSTYVSYGGYPSFTLTDTWQTYTHTFTAPVTVNALFNLDIGAQTGTYCFDAFEFKKNCPAVAIIGNNNNCSGQSSTYQINTPIEGASYQWTVTNGTIIAGQGTTQITVQWHNATNGTVEAVQLIP